MFVTPAFAQGAPAAAPGGADFLIQLLPFLLIFVIMYFLILRPQQKRVKEHREMIKNVRRGDTIVTAGGIIAKVVKVTDDSEVQIEIADNVRARLSRAMISEVKTKGEPVKTDGA
ncbi:preprotein translocase subunit YajC [Chelatococcus sambhunathii]|uniref:Sec translocon accessory complex subunit YajC n=1 Tax=Chelatococcus sambhunathii TaxID=363953 RepID=A0ABU1DAP4_9HYPH|nr:preprotein translocase subunit YajC [Chelatococcus sambhunathii]MDR4305189.1 preprotein translocase subunit YajC [Chelatococcus sambhunathii]